MPIGIKDVSRRESSVLGEFVAGQFVADNSSRTIRRVDNSSQDNSSPDNSSQNN
jgi:hypothetical protein